MYNKFYYYNFYLKKTPLYKLSMHCLPNIAMAIISMK